MGSITESKDSTVEAIQLPVIDISELGTETGQWIVEAATKYGFLYIDTRGTSFTKDNTDHVFGLSKDFFASPLEQKQKSLITSNNRGWTGMHGEILDPKVQRKGDFKEAMNIGEFTANGQPQQSMPGVLQDNVEVVYDFQRACRETCLRVMNLLAIGLEIEEPGFFETRHTAPSGSTLRLLMYPALADNSDYQPDVDIRAGAHSDYGTMTLLFQRVGQPGLEIKTPEDTWAPVPVIPEGFDDETPPILVNIGDLLSYWTNGMLKSTIHRVIFPKDARRGGDDRYSIAYFCHPGNEVGLVPIPSQIIRSLKPIEDGVEVGYGGGAPTKRPLTADEHLQNRLKATYEHLREPGVSDSK